MCMKEYIEKLVEYGRGPEADKLRKMFKISDRSFYTMKARAFINVGNWGELETLVKEKNKKHATIPWFTLVDLLVEKGEYDRVEPYILKMNDVDEQVSILKMINRYKTAADVSF
mmetsp:Transcript_31953/g.28960  ORF Transcript_31953/g.28960 Transcript_31953/m.28960 type:complete len:114 (+) Transcript_31953:146-487(+)